MYIRFCCKSVIGCDITSEPLHSPIEAAIFLLINSRQKARTIPNNGIVRALF